MSVVGVSWLRSVAPVQEPLTLDEAKLHVGLSQDDENVLVVGYLAAAREAAEAYLSRALFTQTWVYTQTDWTREMWLPRAAPLASVTHVKYYDTDGVLQTLSTDVYAVETYSEPGRVLLKPSQTWPDLESERQGPRVFVTYVCGHTSVDSIPELVKQGIRLHLAASEADRQGGSADAVAARAAAKTLWDAVGCVEWREPCHA